MGGLASIPPGYSFYFGDAPEEDVFDGQIEGTLLPGADRDFIFGIYTPLGPASPGMYGFSAQLQIFAATDDRPCSLRRPFRAIGKWRARSSRVVDLLVAASLVPVRFQRPNPPSSRLSGWGLLASASRIDVGIAYADEGRVSPLGRATACSPLTVALCQSDLSLWPLPAFPEARLFSGRYSWRYKYLPRIRTRAKP